MNRFTTAAAYNEAIHSLKSRVRAKDSMISAMLEVSEGYFTEEIIKELDLGICEYENWKKTLTTPNIIRQNENDRAE